eukprot:TRINITY_DN5360_c0_g5_i3.p3 TRINITY_DN5360_c0_g5~~TRINITY_DN5360_c0_g5_i3.p3  ORF type:complete len:248 (+),score=22.02 TRINITY_DN5360_c0_g5_i3:679-1422(+)
MDQLIPLFSTELMQILPFKMVLLTKIKEILQIASILAAKKAIDACNGLDWKTECLLALNYCQYTIFQRLLDILGNINVYDIRKQCTYPPLCYNFTAVQEYINQDKIRAELGVGNRRWEACSKKVYFAMLGDWMKDLELVIPEMLDNGIRMNIYAGADDLICNWLGNRRWVDAMQWSKQQDWSNVQDVEWNPPNDQPAGTIAALGPLWFTKIYNAGHMSPMDQPKNTQYMIHQFTRNQPLIPPTTVEQ